MDKKNLHHLLTDIRKVKIWYIVVPLVISSTICVFALRNNNLEMIKLRSDVYAADKSDQNVEGALNNLRAYVYSHMNTGLSTGSSVYPPIQLKYTYERLQKAETEAVSAQNAKVYTEAEYYCQQQIPNGFSGRVRVPCIESYVTEHGAKSYPIAAAMYKFDFVDPIWSPDLAGFSLLVSVLILLALIVRVGVEYILKKLTS